jgi:pectate lyase
MANRMNLAVSGREVAVYGLGAAAGSVQVTVFDMQGRLLFRRNVAGQNNVFALPGAGSYLVRVGAENHVVKIR